jgi:hypothetical protein
VGRRALAKQAVANENGDRNPDGDQELDQDR